jgi:hypothetical protein
VHEAGSVHRLDRRADGFTVTRETLAQATQTVGIGRRRTDLDRRTIGVEQGKSRRLRLRSKPAYNIELGPPLDSSRRQAGACHWRRPFFMAVLTMFGSGIGVHARSWADTFALQIRLSGRDAGDRA